MCADKSLDRSCSGMHGVVSCLGFHDGFRWKKFPGGNVRRDVQGSSLHLSGHGRGRSRNVQIDFIRGGVEIDSIRVRVADGALTGRRGLSKMSELFAVDDLESMMYDLGGREKVAAQLRREIGVDRRQIGNVEFPSLRIAD